MRRPTTRTDGTRISHLGGLNAFGRDIRIRLGAGPSFECGVLVVANGTRPLTRPGVVGVGGNVGTIKHIVGNAHQSAAEASRQKLQGDPDWQKLSDASFIERAELPCPA